MLFQFQAGLKKIPNGPNQFALVILIGAWNSIEIPPEALASIKSVYKLIKRKTPALLDFGPGYENQLKNWLCKPQNRESDLIAVSFCNSVDSLSIYCYGIETDIVLHVGSKCKKRCLTIIDPVPMTRAKSMLILSKFETADCCLCNVSQEDLPISQPYLNSSGIEHFHDIHRI